MMATDDAVSMFEALTKGKRMGDALLNAADEAGLNVKALLANSDFTDDGRKAIEHTSQAVAKRPEPGRAKKGA